MRELLYVAREPDSTRHRSGSSCPSSATRSSRRSRRRWSTAPPRPGYATILCNTAGSAVREAEYVHMLLERRVDGMIFISSELTDLRSDHRHYVRLREEGARFVFVNGSARVARGDVRRGRRACRGEARDGAPARARASPHRLCGRRSARLADPRQGGGPRSGAPCRGHRARTAWSPTRRSRSRAGGARFASCSRRRAARRPASSARAT